MLSDFDLAKQSNEPGGRPATIHQEENGVRFLISQQYNVVPVLIKDLHRACRHSLVDTLNRYSVMYSRLPNELLCWYGRCVQSTVLLLPALFD